MTESGIKRSEVNRATGFREVRLDVSDQQNQTHAGAPRPVAPPRAASDATIRVVEPGLPAPSAFLGGPDTRLRDLIAFGMAAEAGRPVGPADIAALRQRAESELEVHAFRTLHNRVEAIRIEAMQEQVARLRGGPGLIRLVFANLLAIALAAGLGWAAWQYRADILTLLSGV